MVASPESKYAGALKDKVVIVTGAASGMGKLLVERLVGFGAQVMLVDVNPEVESMSAAFNAEREKATWWAVCDLQKAGGIQEYFDQAVEHFGHVDIVVNNAGIINSASLFSQPDHTDLERVMRINLIAPMEGTRVAVRYFKETGRQGVVLNTGSISGLTPLSFLETYGTSKAAVLYFTASCKDLAPQVRVNAVAPYYVETPFIKGSAVIDQYPMLLKIGVLKPERVVNAMLRALCDKSLAGDTLVITDGNKDERLKIYDDLALQVSSRLAGGLVSSAISFVGSLVSSMARGAIDLTRRRS
ncbi:hypothetical protein H4R18_001765 [Coemansia javaensis]|uniref:Uncharacterized protein n=1 Tax=Coemansia javaensis TaxID=2761396 RepID=A0A9W8LIP7_9FUNG|nr:hypothetical protein H4R18_001765 [Coemansia javaensis]